jgi:hypothetical protein
MKLPTLKQTLLIDAASAALFVILCLGFTDALAGLTGLPATIIAVAGWICVPSAILFAHQAFQPSRGLLALVVFGNLAWVAARLAVWLKLFVALTPVGHAIVIAQAFAVEALMTLEWRGLKASRAAQAAAA